MKSGTLNLDHDEARALHRIVRAMHDGECPRCHHVCASGKMRTMRIASPEFDRKANGVGGWQCRRCRFFITEHAVFKIFAPFMERNLAVFEKWRAAGCPLPVPVETKPDKDDDTEGPFPMYRDEDVTRVHPNVFIHRSDYGYQVVLQAGVQYFDVGPRDDDEKHALFIANMLAKAVGKLAKPEETAVQVVASLKELFPEDMRQSRLRDLERLTGWLNAILNALDGNTQVHVEDRGESAAVEIYLPRGYEEPYNLAVFSGDDQIKNIEDADGFAAHVREVLASSPTTALDRPTPASQD